MNDRMSFHFSFLSLCLFSYIFLMNKTIGDIMTVQAPDGTMVEVEVPEGTVVGQMLTVDYQPTTSY